MAVISEGMYKELTARFTGRSLGSAAAGVINIVLVLWVAHNVAQFTWMLVPAPDLPSARQASKQVATPVATKDSGFSIEQIAGWHLFGIAKVAKPAVKEAVVEVPETRLNLRLMGVLSSDDEKSARAIISDPRGAQKSYAIGDPVPGDAKLAEIHVDRVLLLRNQRREMLRLEKRASFAAKSVAGSRSARKTPVRQLSSKARNLLKGYQRRLDSEPEKLVQELALSPTIRKGALYGFKVKDGANSALFKMLGIRPGDIVTEVNGFSLNNASNGPKVLRSLRSAEQVNLTLLRGSREIKLSFAVP